MELLTLIICIVYILYLSMIVASVILNTNELREINRKINMVFKIKNKIKRDGILGSLNGI